MGEFLTVSLMSHPRSSPDLWAFVAPACAAVSVGALAATLASVRQINPDLRFRWDLLGAGAGLAGAASAWVLSRAFWRLGRETVVGTAQRALRMRVIGGLAAIAALLVSAFGIAVAGLPESQRQDMAVGGVLAVAVLGSVGWTIYRLARIFGGPDDPAE